MAEIRPGAYPVWRRLRRDPGAVLAVAALAVIALFVAAGPMLWRVDPLFIDIAARNRGPATMHPLGTDQLGRDMLARLMLAGRATLTVSLAATVLGLAVGIATGLLSGWVRRLDTPLMRLTEMFLALPLLPMLLLATALFREPLSRTLGPTLAGFLLISGAIAATSWMQIARLSRAEVLTLRQREFILAARASGTPGHRIVLHHLLPNAMPVLMVAATQCLAGAILTESALSVLGLGLPPDFPSWGRLLYDGIETMRQYPCRVLWPGALISGTVLAVNALGEAIQAATGPQR